MRFVTQSFNCRMGNEQRFCLFTMKGDSRCLSSKYQAQVGMEVAIPCTNILPWAFFPDSAIHRIAPAATVTCYTFQAGHFSVAMTCLSVGFLCTPPQSQRLMCSLPSVTADAETVTLRLRRASNTLVGSLKFTANSRSLCLHETPLKVKI